MKKIIFPLLILLVLSSCDTIKTIKTNTENGDVAYIWQGFEHTWDKKVHRVGRLGNWIENSGPEFPRNPSIHHGAQSGTEKDSASFSTKYSVIQAANTTFHQGLATIDIQTQEREIRTFNQRVEVNRSEVPGLADHDNIEVILNGFDLKKVEFTTKKLGVLEISIGPVTVNSATVQFDINGEVSMSCNSAECALDLPKFHYALEVHYLLIASNENDFQPITHPEIGNSYDYDSKVGTIVINDPATEYSLGNTISPRFPVKVKALAMKGFRFQVSKRVSAGAIDPVPHLYKWKMWLDYVDDFELDAPKASSLMKFEHKMSLGNVGHIGHVDISIQPISLLFKGGSSLACNWNREHDFSNNNPSGSTHYSEDREYIGILDADCFPRPVQ